jgi:hypothetical protein
MVETIKGGRNMLGYGYGGFGGCFNQCFKPCFNPCFGFGYNNAIILVLFILLVIIIGSRFIV